MKNKILLVDDEKALLKSLKSGLKKFSGQFTTDICFSVNEAVKKIDQTDYDLLITDIRMPKKSGVDLLLHLKKANFKGAIKVMSAYHDAENLQKINSLGVMNIISKPFDLQWFRNMILDFFNSREEASATFDSIDLVSVMQMINIDKRSAKLQLDLEDSRGIIHFRDGEIINAEFGDIGGIDAISKLVSYKRGFISVKKPGTGIKNIINKPFIELLMDILKKNDEKNKDEISPKKGKKNIKFKEVKMVIKEVLAVLEDVSGYMGSGVFTPQGEMLEGSSEVSGISFEQSGSLVHDILNKSKNLTSEAGFGDMHMIQLYTDMGIIFAVCHSENDQHFHTILVINNNGNVAMGKLKMEKVVNALKTVI